MIVPVGPGASPDLLALNQSEADLLSPLDPERFESLVRGALHAWRIGSADALLIAFDQDAGYDSPNFLWFRARLSRFVYVDRVVVARARRGAGLARRLYEALFDAARRAGHDRVVCEVSLHPPNPGSDAFHAALGFVPIGEGTPHAGKAVRYLACRL